MLENANTIPKVPAIAAIVLLPRLTKADISPTRIIPLRLNLAVLTHCQQGDDRKRETKKDHHPVHESRESAGVVSFPMPSAPTAVAATTYCAHHCRTEHAAVAHARGKGRDQQKEKLTALGKFICLLSLHPSSRKNTPIFASPERSHPHSR